MNLNKHPANQPAQPPPRHAETRTAEAQARELINRALKGPKIAAVQDCTVGATRLLRSGDYRFFTAASRETETLKQHPEEWIACLGSNAATATKPTSVIVDGVRISTVYGAVEVAGEENFAVGLDRRKCFPVFVRLSSHQCNMKGSTQRR